MEATESLVGRLLGQYGIVEQIGAGGTSNVYLAIQGGLNRQVALKVLPPELATKQFTERFRIEAETLAKLDHANILTIFDFGSMQGVTYLAMPYIKGGSLRELIDKRRLDMASAWRILVQVSDALEHAHQVGIIHRDIKPSNVLMHPDGRAVLSDFGLAKPIDVKNGVTAAGFTVGTPGYMAPEQVMGGQVDVRADVYALAAMAFEMLTGTPPYDGATAVDVLSKTVNWPVPRPSERNPNLPDIVDAAIMRALSKSPMERPATVREFINELRGHGSSSRIPAVTSTPPPGGLPVASSPAYPAVPGSSGGGLPQVMPGSAPGGMPQVPPSQQGMPAVPPSQRITMPKLSSSTALPTGAVAMLGQLGMHRLRADVSTIRNNYFATALRSAKDVVGDHWTTLLQTAGLNHLLFKEPADDREHKTPAVYMAQLAEAFDYLYQAQAPEVEIAWGTKVVEDTLAARKATTTQRRVMKLVPGQHRRVELLINSFCASMNEVMGAELVTYRKMDDKQWWIAFYQNPIVVNRKKVIKSCHYWLGGLSALLRWAGLANDYTVSEIECGSITGVPDCVFAIRAAGDK